MVWVKVIWRETSAGCHKSKLLLTAEPGSFPWLDLGDFGRHRFQLVYQVRVWYRYRGTKLKLSTVHVCVMDL